MAKRGKIRIVFVVGILIVLGLLAFFITRAVSSNSKTANNSTIINQSLSKAGLPPSILPPPDITINATGTLTTISSLGTPNATDPSGISPTVTNNAPAGGFPTGTTTVIWTAINAAGLNATAGQEVTVNDPIFSPVSSQTVDSTSSIGTVVTFTPVAVDYSNGSIDAVSCNPPSGSTFSIGTTQVRCTATDNASNTAHITFNVIVKDTIPPVISSTSDIKQEATSSSGNTVNYAIPAVTDYVDGSDIVTCSPTAGSLFPLGSTKVTCSSTDSLGLTGTSTFNIIVQDTTPPVISNVPSNIAQGNTSVSGATITYTLPTATDIVDGTDTVTCNPISGFNFTIGTTQVSCSATDNAGNTAYAQFYVNITSP